MISKRTIGVAALLAALSSTVIATTATAAKFTFTADEVEDIVGEIQKPDVVVVISRENLNKAYKLDLEESFLQRIVESVEHPPF